MTAPDDDILAAEIALGLLGAQESADADARLVADAAFALRVAWWRDQLGPLADELAVEPPTTLWPRIASRLASNDDVPDTARPWRWATAISSAAAAVLLGVVVLRPDAAPPPPAPTVAPPVEAVALVASLSGKGGTAVTVAYDRTAARLLVTPVALERGAGDVELWVIPVGQTAPVSLGVVDADRAGLHTVDAAKVGLLAQGATFALSQEARGGSATGAPQGPIVASGKIIRV